MPLVPGRVKRGEVAGDGEKRRHPRLATNDPASVQLLHPFSDAIWMFALWTFQNPVSGLTPQESAAGIAHQSENAVLRSLWRRAILHSRGKRILCRRPAARLFCSEVLAVQYPRAKFKSHPVVKMKVPPCTATCSTTTTSATLVRRPLGRAGRTAQRLGVFRHPRL